MPRLGRVGDCLLSFLFPQIKIVCTAHPIIIRATHRPSSAFSTAFCVRSYIVIIPTRYATPHNPRGLHSLVPQAEARREMQAPAAEPMPLAKASEARCATDTFLRPETARAAAVAMEAAAAAGPEEANEKKGELWPPPGNAMCSGPTADPGHPWMAWYPWWYSWMAWPSPLK